MVSLSLPSVLSVGLTIVIYLNIYDGNPLINIVRYATPVIPALTFRLSWCMIIYGILPVYRTSIIAWYAVSC
jgi:hypothetical protein